MYSTVLTIIIIAFFFCHCFFWRLFLEASRLLIEEVWMLVGTRSFLCIICHIKTHHLLWFPLCGLCLDCFCL